MIGWEVWGHHRYAFRNTYGLTEFHRTFGETHCLLFHGLEHTDEIFKANLHIPCRSHAFPRPCRSAKGLECVFPVWFTQRRRVWFIHAMSCPCHATTMLLWKRIFKATAQRGMGTAWERHGMCELASEVLRRHVGDLPAFGYFRLPRGVPRRLLL
jgi:hypothetical protein